MIELYTIGFTNKSAETFFKLLINADIKEIIDIRVSVVSQLAGFAKGDDLRYFAKEIAGISYIHKLEFAPTKELTSAFRKKEITWQDYEVAYLNMLDERDIIQNTDFEILHKCCLLCSEHLPEFCHRRLLAEYLKRFREDLDIIHLF